MPKDAHTSTPDSESQSPSRRGRRQNGRRKPGRSPNHRRYADLPGPAVAAIDLGTHNCRLLIAKPGPDGPTVIDGFSRIVRLGEGIAGTSALCEDAIGRTISALRVCASKLRRHNVSAYRAVATEACRRADNCGTFFDRVSNATGIKLETIPADEEAFLTMAGCVPLLKGAAKRGLMFDIGGGSTELTWIDLNPAGEPQVLGTTSLPIGVVTMVETFGSPDCSADAFDGLVAEVDARLTAFDQAHGITGSVAQNDVLMLGTSGTVTTLGAIHLGLGRYDRSKVDGMTLSVEAILDLSAKVSRLNCDQRSELACIGPERADLMVMGCAILVAILRRWPVPEIRIADRGIREGVLLALMENALRARAERGGS